MEALQAMPFPFMNSAGWTKTLSQVERLTKVPSLTHVIYGSGTPDGRLGNVGGTNFHVGADGTGTNSLGLNNGGIPYLKEHGREMVRIAHAAGKKFIVNVAGFSPQDYVLVVMIAIDIGADGVEINAGCPNVIEGGKHKDIASFSPTILGAIIAEMDALQRTFEPVWWLKVSPMANPKDLEWIAEMVKSSSCSALVATNAFPNISLYHENGRPFLDVANNYGGMSGKALKPISLSNCRRYRELLPDFPIYGVGGIDSGKDVDDYRKHAGVTGIQIGSAFFHLDDPNVLHEIATQYLLNY